MGIVLAVPLTVPYVPVAPTVEPVFMSWTGFDGSVWVMSDPDSMPAMRPGVTGLHMPRMTRYKSSTPLVDGAEVLGYSIPERPVYWPMVFRAKNVTAWRDIYSGFFDSIHPVETGVWTVGEDDDARTLELTGVFDDDYPFDRDPFMTEFAQIGVELEAPRPLWRGKTITVTFSGAAQPDFIDPAGSPPFHIASMVGSFTDAQITNPGNEPSYLAWTVKGPLSEISLGVGGAVIDVPFNLDEGDVLVIDTDPTAQYATLNGVDCTRTLGFQVFAPVPAKQRTSLVVAGNGEGSAEASISPLFWRAF